jgi:hypothetical protein
MQYDGSRLINKTYQGETFLWAPLCSSEKMQWAYINDISTLMRGPDLPIAAKYIFQEEEGKVSQGASTDDSSQYQISRHGQSRPEWEGPN